MAEPEEQEVPGHPPHEKVMSLGDHLEELRTRLLICLGFLAAFSVTAGFFIQEIHGFITRPYVEVTTSVENPGGLKLMLGSVMDSIDTMIHLSLAVGFTVGLPICVFVMFEFVTPALSRRIAWMARVSVGFSCLLFWSGLLFCWNYLFPISMQMMFKVFLPPNTQALLSLQKYYDFFFLLHAGTGITFQMPLVIVILGALGVLPVAAHKKAWRFIVIFIFIFSAIVTPPDPLSQLVVAFPLVIFYGIAVLIVFLIERARGAGESLQGEAPEADRPG